MDSRYKLIVGLGNPGAEYDQTRHNAGFWFLDELAARQGLAFAQDRITQSLVARGGQGSDAVILLKPMSFMNRSGFPVSAAARYWKIDASQILVVHDELDFSPGTVKLKVDGGHGGHNGLKSIIAQLGSAKFARLRIGIGHPGDRNQVANYVLKRPLAAEATAIRDAIERAVKLMDEMQQGRLDAVMNALHGAAPTGRGSKETGNRPV